MTSKSKSKATANTTPATEVVNPTVTVTATAVAASKADKARAIFSESYAQAVVPQRKDIIARMQNEAGLTKAGAATYLQNFKNKAGLVVKKATVVSA